MTITTRKRSTEIPWTEPLDTPDLRAEATAAAEEQLAVDRALARELLEHLGDAITGRRKFMACRLLVALNWLEHRITQTELMHTALWCRECGPADMPQGPWMAFECLEHAEEMLQRSAKSWERSLFS